MERGEHVTSPHEHVANLHEYVTNLSECVANMSRAPTIMSGLRLKRYNVNDHRAAANDIVFKSRPARGSVCVVLLFGDSFHFTIGNLRPQSSQNFAFF